MNDDKKLDDNQFEAAGHVWTFRITAADVLMLKNDYGFDVRAVADPDKLTEIMDDTIGLLSLMASVLGKQLEARDMTATQLFEDLSGDAVENAVYCFIAGCCGFFGLGKRLALLELLTAIRTNANQCGLAVAEAIKLESAEMTKQAVQTIQQQPPTVQQA